MTALGQVPIPLQLSNLEYQTIFSTGNLNSGLKVDQGSGCILHLQGKELMKPTPKLKAYKVEIVEYYQRQGFVKILATSEEQARERVSDMYENDLVPEMVFEDVPHHSGEAWNIGTPKEYPIELFKAEERKGDESILDYRMLEAE